MKFTIITHTPHIENQNMLFAYGPYVREMNIWLKNCDEVTIVAPLVKKEPDLIHAAYNATGLKLKKVPSFSAIGIISKVKAFLKLPYILYVVFNAMKSADHIHLRCPGNMGLLGCFVQILFPSKLKTAKYAGNWDSKSSQPFSYCLQKWILSNTFLTKNMQVLVYGEWPNQSKNIKSFFTATYYESDKITVIKRNLKETIRFVFAGSLTSGKGPLYALKLVDKLRSKGCDLHFDLYGEGVEREYLQAYISENELSDVVVLHGNQSAKTVLEAYKKAHFLFLPSKSEGWPKVVAEAMFWGCIPIASAVSCVPNMLDYGNRGILLSMNIDADFALVNELLQDESAYIEKAIQAERWSRNYTLDTFEAEIKKILQ